MKADGPQEDFAEQLAGLDLGLLLTSTASTIASLAYTKLERGDLAQAKLGIDALTALLPVLDADARRDLGAALANLQVAYASRVSTPPRRGRSGRGRRPHVIHNCRAGALRRLTL